MSASSNHPRSTSRFASDESFDRLYPDQIREVAAKHWTPIEIAREAAAFLAVTPQSHILDIGSGAGKFCFVAANQHPNTQFTGIEQRGDLVTLCQEVKEKLKLNNTAFIHQNMADFDLQPYDHFYFYNSFYENKTGTQKIDFSVPYSERLYDYYNMVLYKQLRKKPAGTRLVTYHSLGNEVPPEYEIVRTAYAEFLKFWIKV